MPSKNLTNHRPWFQMTKAQRTETVSGLIEALLHASDGGLRAARALSDSTDRWLCELFDANLSQDQVSILAVGGYGRRELCPHSDLDLLVTVKSEPSEALAKSLETTLYQLWDAGFKVGYGIRTIAETIKLAQEDLDTKTAVLQARHLWGDLCLSEEFQRRVWRGLFQGKTAQFAEQKLAERAARRAQAENSRMALEPNIKEGSGGLRDIHALQWISRAVFNTNDWEVLVQRDLLKPEQLSRLIEIEDWQLKLRFFLHDTVGRPEERLTFDLQAEIAPLMGFDHNVLGVAPHQAVEHFMRQYYLNAWWVKIETEIALAALKEDHARGGWDAILGFILPDGRDDEWRVRRGQLMFQERNEFERDPLAVLRLFLASVDKGMQVHPKTLQMITTEQSAIPDSLGTAPETSQSANALLMQILTHPKNPVATLRLMSDTGVLHRTLPEWLPIAGMMQFNRYHHYTVDAHTLRALEWMHVLIYGQPEKRVGQLNADQAKAVHQLGVSEGLRQLDNLAGREHASEIAKQFPNRRALFVAMLLHDLMKGRDGDHSILGADMALDTCPRMGLLSEETELVSWLVREHLTMSNTAFKRDLEDPQTIELFADRVGSIERLEALYVLTVCDISAVGPDTWSNWKAALLAQLFRATEQRIRTGQKLPSERAKARQRREELAATLNEDVKAQWDDLALARVLRKLSDDYLSHVPLELQLTHAALIREAEDDNEIRFSVVQDTVDNWTQISVYCVDHHGLFAGIAGAISVLGYSIEAVRAYTLRNGMALDSFAIRTADGKAVTDQTALTRLKSKITQVIQGDTSMRQALVASSRPRSKRLSVLDRPAVVRFDNEASERFTVLEVEGSNVQGDLYRIASILTRQNIQIQTAKISSYGSRFVDVFYLLDGMGGKIQSQGKLDAISRKILEQLNPSEDPNT